jgi:ribosomal protein S18 acetylase RimI-like enzyme
MQTKNLRYYKRYRMELDLRNWRCSERLLPPGYSLIPWNPGLLDEHAEVKYLSFRDEIDAQVFPCLGAYESCRQLMQEIQGKKGFLPEATWLARYEDGELESGHVRYCGTIQAIVSPQDRGGIQNIGVTPHHRGNGLGIALIMASLKSFQRLGLHRARLEVTAVNHRAVELYQRLGFSTVRTLYKTVELAYCDSAR